MSSLKVKQQLNKNMNAVILREDFSELGTVALDAHEVKHFSSTGSVPARIALDVDQIAALEIGEDDYIYIRESSSERRNADRIDGYDRDDIGESPDY